jgi:N utilization substance protein B
MKRRNEREFALKVLFACEYNDLPVHQQIANLDLELLKYETKFSRKIIDLALEKSDEIDKSIKKQLHNWDFERVAVIDKLLLRMAVVEFLYFEDVPPEVTINEMIEISKLYSTERSGKFLNGILDALVKNLRKDGLIKKTGRGLVSRL